MKLSVMIVLLITILTKLVAFIKQILIASVFGANTETDSFYLAYGFLTSLTYAFFSALSVTLVPIYQGINKKSKEDANVLIGRVMVCFVSISVFINIILLLNSRNISKILLIKSNMDYTRVAIYISILSPMVIFGCVNSILGAVIEGNKVFIYSKSSGLVTSIWIILLTLLFKDQGVICLAYGILLSSITQFIILIYGYRKYNIAKIKKPFWDKNVKSLCMLICPLLLGNGIYEINKMIDKIISSSFEAGSTSSLSYGQSLFDSFCALTITSTIAVFFTYISDYASSNKDDSVLNSIDNCVAFLLLLVIPIEIIVLANGESIVSIVYGHGAFDEASVLRTAQIIKGYAIGFPFLIFREIMAKTHYAYKDSKKPMQNSILAVFVNVIFSIILSKVIGIQGISIATSISYFVCAILMIISVKKHISYSILKRTQFYLKIIISALLTSFINLLLFKQSSANIGHLIILCVVTYVDFYGMLLLLRCKEIVDILPVIKNKFFVNKRGNKNETK